MSGGMGATVAVASCAIGAREVLAVAVSWKGTKRKPRILGFQISGAGFGNAPKSGGSLVPSNENQKVKMQFTKQATEQTS